MSDQREQLGWEIAESLAKLVSPQQQWAEHLARRQVCLAAPDSARLLELAEAVLQLSSRLNALLETREKLLAQGSELGLPAASLEKLVNNLETPQRQQLKSIVRNLTRRADALRRESWSQWVVCQRSLHHYNDLVHFIANGGRKSPSYGKREQPFRGGAIIDALI